MIKKSLLLFILLLFLIAPCTALNTSTVENDQFTPAADGVIFASDEIDATAPDKKTAEAFLWSSTGSLVFDTILHNENQDPLKLKNFSYHTSDGSVIVRDITASELFDTMNTTISAYGWLTSVHTHEYIEIAVEEPAQRSDLINLWNFIQETAKQNGFEKTIPVRFVTIQLIDTTQDPTCIYGDNGSVSCNYDPTPKPTASPIPLAGLIGGLGIAAVMTQRIGKF